MVGDGVSEIQVQVIYMRISSFDNGEAGDGEGDGDVILFVLQVWFFLARKGESLRAYHDDD